MNRLVEFLAEHGGMLTAGLTAWLALGAAAMRLARSPIHSLRIGEATLLLAGLWAALACVPLKRYSPADVWSDVGNWLAVNEIPPADAASLSPRQVDSAGLERDLRIVPTLARRPIEPIAWQPIGSQPVGTRRRPAVGPRRAVPVQRLDRRVQPVVAESPARPASGVNRSHGNRPVERADAKTPTTGAAAEATVRWRSPRRLAAAYLVGNGLAIAWLLFGRLALRRLERTARPLDPWLIGLYASLLPAQLSRPPRLLVSDRCGRPLSFGLWRPVILLPRSLCHRHHAGALRHVLRHELAHVGQRDAWGHLLFNIAFPCCYFHPLYWWLRARAGLCRELIADDQAAGGTDKRAYVSDLLEVARQWRQRRDVRLGALGVFESSSQFYRRMTMLCERERALDRSCGWWWRGGVLMAGCLAIALLGLTLGRPAAAADDARTASLLALADDDDRDEEEARDEADDDEGESEEDERDADESESEEDDDDSEDESDNEAEDDDGDSDEDESEEESDDGDDAEDEDEDGDEGEEGPDEESEDEDSENESDDEEREAEEDGAAEEEGDLDALMVEKEELAARLAELESTIEETAARRAQRDAERASAEEEEARRAAEEAEAGQWQDVLEALGQLTEQQQQLQETVAQMAERIEELTRDRDSLAEEVSSLRERLQERDEQESDEDASER
jgi:hypothetical protein